MRSKHLPHLVTATLAATLVAGCHRAAHTDADHGHDHGAEADHAHEEKTAQITVWTNGYEIFAEHKAAVAGAPTTFTTHVTDLSTLQPRREGPVKFVLSPDGAAPLEHLQAAPARPGIYLPAITFPKPGKWQIQIVVQDKTISLGEVEVFSNEHDAAHAEFPEPAEGISFLKEQQWKVSVKSEPVIQRSLTERLRVPAVVQPKPGLQASVNAPIAGRLLPVADKALPGIGDRVEAGQVLAVLQPSFSEIGARMVEAEAEVARAKLALDQAQVVFNRVEALAKAEARTTREVQEAEFALKTARANFEAANSLRSVYRSVTAGLGTATNGPQPMLELKAPISGTIVRQNGVALGEYIAAERTLYTILDSRSLYIEARLRESDARRLGQTRSATYQRTGEHDQHHPILGNAGSRLVFAGTQIDPETRTLPLIYELPNPEGRLLVGEALTLHVETQHAENTLAIPESAIVEDQGVPVAFVQLAGETFERRELKLGIRDGLWVQVLSGLQKEERVVTQGAYAVRLAAASGALPAHGHAH